MTMCCPGSMARPLNSFSQDHDILNVRLRQGICIASTGVHAAEWSAQHERAGVKHALLAQIFRLVEGQAALCRA